MFQKLPLAQRRSTMLSAIVLGGAAMVASGVSISSTLQAAAPAAPTVLAAAPVDVPVNAPVDPPTVAAPAVTAPTVTAPVTSYRPPAAGSGPIRTPATQAGDQDDRNGDGD